MAGIKMAVWKLLHCDGSIKILHIVPSHDDIKRMIGGYPERIVIGRNALWLSHTSKHHKSNAIASQIINSSIHGHAILELNS
jgi:hypothetical protein